MAQEIEAKNQRSYPMKATPEQFLKTWQESKSVDEVAEKLKMKPSAVRSRVSMYRKLGVKPKKMPHASGRSKLNIAALNQLCDEAKG